MTCPACGPTTLHMVVDLQEHRLIRAGCSKCMARLELTDSEKREVMAEIRGYTVETAIAIINEARSSGVSKAPMPETDEEKFEFADRIVKMARHAYHNGSKRKDVHTIISLAGPGDPPLPEPEQASPEEQAESIAPAHHGNGGVEMNGGNGPSPEVTDHEAAMHEEAILESEEKPEWSPAQEAVNRVKSMGLPVPRRMEDAEATPMPRDPTVLSDQEVRRLYAQWGVVRNYAGWRLSCEEADLRALNHILAFKRKETMKTIPRMEDGKAKLSVVIEAEVDTDPGIVTLMEKQVILQGSVHVLKSLYEIYSGNVDRLSREMTFRSFEWQKAHG